MDRRTRGAALLTVAVTLLLLHAGACARFGKDDKDEDTDRSPLIGKQAPEIAPDFAVNGTPVTLADLRGKVVLLDFWAVWCGPCREALPHVRDLSSKYKSKGLEVVGVTTYFKRFGFDKGTGEVKRLEEKLTRGQEQKVLSEFAEYNKLGYHVVALPTDDWQSVLDQYRLGGIPTLVVIDRKGKVQMIKTGSEEENLQAIDKEIKKLLAAR
jgi:thiol-disulfide isomerase/thioredoxin